MYNYNNFVSSSDRYSVPGADEYKIQHLSRRLKYPLEDILRAVQEVGFDKEEVEEYIRDRYNRS